jgi:hypothetical protein
MTRATRGVSAGRGLDQQWWGTALGRALFARGRAGSRRGGVALAELHCKAVSPREEGGGGTGCAEHQMRCAASHRGRAASRAASRSAELQLCVCIRGWAMRQHVVRCDCLWSRVGQPGEVVLPALCAAQCLCSRARLRARAGAEDSFQAAGAAAQCTVMVGAPRGEALRPCDARAGARVLALGFLRAFNPCGTGSGRLESGAARLRASQRSHGTRGEVAPVVKCHACMALRRCVHQSTCAVTQLGHATPQNLLMRSLSSAPRAAAPAAAARAASLQICTCYFSADTTAQPNNTHDVLLAHTRAPANDSPLPGKRGQRCADRPPHTLHTGPKFDASVFMPASSALDVPV